MHILIIDNYDSFTYNLVHYVEQCTSLPVRVRRNDAIEKEDTEGAERVILSPGPGIPSEAGELLDFIEKYATTGKPILGVCLGYQALAAHFGAKLENRKRVYHGVQDIMIRTQETCLVLGDTAAKFKVGRYHSWVASKEQFPGELIPTSHDSKGEIMSFKHRSLPVYGVQFHPECIMTPTGLEMIKNFVLID